MKETLNRNMRIHIPWKLFKALVIFTIVLIITCSVKAQTTINSGSTINASTIPAGNSITISAGGTLNMDVARSFASIITANSGTSTISGNGLLTVTGVITIDQANTLSMSTVSTATQLTTNNLNNNTAGIAGTGTLTVTDVIENKKQGNNNGIIDVGTGFTLICVQVAKGSGNNGSWNMTVEGTLKLSSTYNLDGLTANTGSTIEYNGSSQAVVGINYYNLILSGSATKTLSSATTTISGNFTIGGSAIVTAVTGLTIGGNVLLGSGTNFTAGNYTHMIAGNWTNNGTSFTPGSGTIILNGTTQTIDGTAVTTFYNLTTVGTGTKSQGASTIVTNILNLNNTAPISIGSNSFTINGSLSGAGFLIGSSSSNLVIAGSAGTLTFDQTSAATRSLNNLTFTAGGSATIASALDIYGAITLTSATLHLAGQNLTLKSTVSGTASIGNLTGNTLDGATNVTIERFITSNTYRAWRLLSAPTRGQTIHQSWQENQVAGSTTLTGFGTQITGPSGTGFDFISHNYSMLTYNQAGGSWTGVTNTSNLIDNTSGYFLYIRGDRTQTPANGITPTNSTIMRTNGTFYQGTQTAISIPAGKYGLLGNIYPSTIDIRNLVKSGIDNTIYIWDPKLYGAYGVGAYQTLTYDVVSGNFKVAAPGGGSYGAVGTIVNTIQSGQAFMVHGTTGGGGGSVQFVENSKTTGSSSGVFGPQSTGEQLITSLYAVSVNGNILVDGALNVYDNLYNNSVDGDDGEKISNSNENFAIMRSGISLSVEKRQPINTTDTIFFKMTQMKQTSYHLEFTASSLDHPGLLGKLVDNYLGTSTQLNLNDLTTYDFTVTADGASAATGRFMIVFYTNGPLPVTFTDIRVWQQGKDNAVEWKTDNEVNISKYEVERSTDGTAFSKVGTVDATGNAGNAVTYNWLDLQPAGGNNFYRVRSIDRNGQIKYSSIVRINILKGNPGFLVYPNPVVNATINLQCMEMPAGVYQARLLSYSGQVLFIRSFNHIGGNSVHSILLDNTEAKGNYNLEIIGVDGVKQLLKIIVE